MQKKIPAKYHVTWTLYGSRFYRTTLFITPNWTDGMTRITECDRIRHLCEKRGNHFSGILKKKYTNYEIKIRMCAIDY